MWKDLAFVAAAFLVSAFTLMSLQIPVPGGLTILVTLAVAHWRLRRQGLGWREVAFAQPYGLGRQFGATLGWMALGYLAAALSTGLLVKGLGWATPDFSRYGELHGNLPRLLFLLGIAWTTAAFGEELLFRGFLLNRLQAALGGTRTANVLAVLGQAALFGVSHGFQGPTGIFVTASIGLVWGIAAARRRHLGPLILAHGLVDTLSLTALYLGFRPGS